MRRKFLDRFERTGADIIKHAIRKITDRYTVEKKARDNALEERFALRQEKANPILDALEAWLQTQLPKTSGRRTKPAVRFLETYDRFVRRAAFGARCSECQLRAQSSP